MTYKNWREEDSAPLRSSGKVYRVRRGENTTGQWNSKIKEQIEVKGHKCAHSNAPFIMHGAKKLISLKCGHISVVRISVEIVETV